MKKIFAVLCLVLMLFSFAACKSNINVPDNSFNSESLEAFVSANEEKLSDMIINEFGYEGEIEIKVQGKGIVFDIKTPIFDNANEDIKLQLQAQASEAAETYDEVIEEMKAKEEGLSELEYITVTLRASDGTFIATASNR